MTDLIGKTFLWVFAKACILPESEYFPEFILQGEIPNLLLSGTAGVGKVALCNQLGAD